ncbi:hypothetical protein [Ruegeria atlantica]|uniref:hypothetical protein n=1 Tax=Ruegeria atlantica TaxID=81569 RepID=UPI00148054E2|nr:hypothetical protein [Ruegeria atlantica]
MSMRRFMDVVNWDTIIAPGVLLCKDGSYLAGWRVTGIDTESIAPDEVQALRVQIATGLSHLGDAHTLWTVWQRRPRTPEDLIADTGDIALDILADETNSLFSAPGQVWQDQLTLFLGWSPEHSISSAAELEGFEEARALLESWFDPILALDRIDPPQTGPVFNPDLVRILAALLGENRPAPRLGTGALPVGLDALLAPALFQRSAGGPVRIGDRPLAVMTLSGEREAYLPAPLERVQDLDLPLIWITRHQAMSKQAALARAAWKQKTWSQAGANMLANIEGSGGGTRSLFADRMAARMDETRAVIESGVTGHGNFLSVLLLYGGRGAGPETLTRDIRRIRETVQLGGFALTEERTGAVPVLLSALPGHATPTCRDAMVGSQVTADLMPVRGLWPGSPTCPSPLLPPGTRALLPALTRSGELFHFNLHVSDVGHTLIFGPTGTGKSVLLGQLVAAWLRYRDAQVIVFDRGRSIRHACAALNGIFLEPGIGGETGVAPLDQIDRLGAAWALDWLTNMVRLGIRSQPGPDQIQELRAALDLMIQGGDTSLPRLADLVQDKILRQVFAEWLTGPHAGLFDRQGSDIAGGLAGARLTVFETHPLFEAREAVALLSLDYIFAEVARRFDGRPTLLVIDEGWFFLDHEVFAERIRFWLKEGRKMNLALVLATQSISDAARSPIITDLLESCPTRLYLASPTATTEVNAPQYRQVGLDNAGIATVAGLRPKREMLMVQDRITRVLGFPLTPVGLSILGRTTKTDSARAAERAAHDPDFWMEDIANEDIVRGAME